MLTVNLCGIWWTSHTKRMSCTCKGSTKSFQTGKNYKRCKRMHEILSLLMEKLHFESFLETYENAEDIRSLIVQEL